MIAPLRVLSNGNSRSPSESAPETVEGTGRLEDPD
jgi:hypothetical protein